MPSTRGETIEDYRDRVWTAGLAASTGMARYLKTLLWRIPGVQKRLVSVRQDLPTGRYIVLVGGGDPYQVGYAIYFALFWTGGLLPAQIEIIDISNANPAVVQTANNHNLQDGMIERIDGVQAPGLADRRSTARPFPVTMRLDHTLLDPVRQHGAALGLRRRRRGHAQSRSWKR